MAYQRFYNIIFKTNIHQLWTHFVYGQSGNQSTQKFNPIGLLFGADRIR